MTGFVLTSPSLTDMDDELNVQDARAWLQRALDGGDDAALARWAKAYGLPLLDSFEEAFDTGYQYGAEGAEPSPSLSKDAAE